MTPPEPATGSICSGLEITATAQIAVEGELGEISGAVTSHRIPGSVWVHEDSGNEAVLTEIGPKGGVRSHWTVPGAGAVDWEDMASAPDPDGVVHLFVGDIGDNEEKREHLAVLRLREPSPSDTSGTTAEPSVLTLALPTPRNLEALLVDPHSGDLVVATKSLDGVTEILVAEGAAWEPHGTEVGMQRVGSLRLGFGRAVLAGDVSPDGSLLALRTPVSVLLWARPDPSASPAEVLTGSESCEAPAPFDPLGEALALTGDGYVLVGEAERPELVVVSGPGAG
ncbi:MAG: hypothetical protein U5K29_02185 [Acidimicrobiales bacterium]|nr:hypothetical protein [Acidimicrobiales bacterium]